MNDNGEAAHRLVANERIKLTAGYLNTAAGALFGAGVVAPIAAAVFGFVGPAGHLPTLTPGLGALIFRLACPFCLQAKASSETRKPFARMIDQIRNP